MAASLSPEPEIARLGSDCDGTHNFAADLQSRLKRCATLCGLERHRLETGIDESRMLFHEHCVSGMDHGFAADLWRLRDPDQCVAAHFRCSPGSSPGIRTRRPGPSGCPRCAEAANGLPDAGSSISRRAVKPPCEATARRMRRLPGVDNFRPAIEPAQENAMNIASAAIAVVALNRFSCWHSLF